MRNIDKQALRDIAAAVESAPLWHAVGVFGEVVDPAKPEWKPVHDFCKTFTAERVLALLDELEARDKSISFLKDQLAQLANFNPDWDKLEAATDSLREHMAELTAARKRIAELSTSHSNLREAMAGIHNTITAGGAYTPLAAILNASKAAYEESAAAAGKGEAS